LRQALWPHAPAAERHQEIEAMRRNSSEITAPRVQYLLRTRVQNRHGLDAAAAVPIQEIQRELMNVGIRRCDERGSCKAARWRPCGSEVSAQV
jgi:hypothetical protein